MERNDGQLGSAALSGAAFYFLYPEPWNLRGAQGGVSPDGVQPALSG